MRSMKLGYCALLLGMTLTLGACSLLPEAKPVQSWTLTPVAAHLDEGQSEVQLTDLRILRPQAQDLLSGNYLLVVPEGQPVSVYKDARWGATIPNLWRDYLVTALQQDSRFARISNDEVRVAAEYELISRLDAFQSEYHQGQPVAVMRGYLQLVDANSRAIIAERPLQLSEPATGEEVAAVVKAFENLMASTSEEIRNWLLQVQQQKLSRP